jgi:hypothetical protein
MAGSEVQSTSKKGDLRSTEREAITDSVDGQEVAWRRGIRLKLMPKPRHVNIHGSGIRVEIITPGRIQDCVPRERTVDILNKEQQKIVLGRRYAYNVIATHDLSAADIDRHIREVNYLVRDVALSSIRGRVDRAKMPVHAGRFRRLDHDKVIHLQSPFRRRNQLDFSNSRHAFSTALTFLTSIVWAEL